ncbi:uncharacterized protein PgNI_00555 [Pyricularia grisea]|uniref:Metal homeostatis protein bsd2 n=1 Tax=Pyricularia grisea TaxID=148305 RepID=A0A6P8BM30_PYRGI|nr:uncharacterized protein PgNI_00555 [Pyricularia grisea]TLD17652.1 hypothetical protein PgNI_00555 [Pyricularia grisea]
MAGGYERVNAHDEEDHSSSFQPDRIPNSPPPSFRSRESSIFGRDRNDARPKDVDTTLADAFDSADDSDDDVDDTQRLVRATPGTSQASTSAAPSSSSSQVGVNPTATRNTATPGGQPATAQSPASPSGAAATPFRVYGAGMQSDGVFSNLSAKPERGEEKEEQPPTYEQAAADAAPPYWETTIMAPGFGGADEVYIDGMPVGSFFSFVWNGMITITFQPLIGFLLTYLLHSTHAAKNGSRGGLGITLIQYGFQFKATTGAGAGSMHTSGSSEPENYAEPPDPNAHDFDPNAVQQGGAASGGSDISGSDWLAYVLMIVGWFILIRSLSDYIRARRHEQLVLQSPDRGLGVAIVAEGETPDRAV